MVFDSSKIEEIRQSISEQTLTDIENCISTTKNIMNNIPHSVKIKKNNCFKLNTLLKNLENSKEDIIKLTSFLYNSVSKINDVENQIHKDLLSNSSFGFEKKGYINKLKEGLAKYWQQKQEQYGDTGSEIFDKCKSSFMVFLDIFKLLEAVGANYEPFNDNYVIGVADESLDEGIINKTTIIDTEGNRLEYSKKEKERDGTIKYFDGDKLIKQINPDGTVIVYKNNREIHFKYNFDGSYEIITLGYKSPNYYETDSSSEKRYYDKNGNLIKEEVYLCFTIENMNDQTLRHYTEYKDGYEYKYNSNGIPTSVYKDKEIIKSYYENGQIEWEKGKNGTIYYYENGQRKSDFISDVKIDYNKDGSVDKVNDEGFSQLLQKMNADKVEVQYLDDGSAELLIKNKVIGKISSDGNYEKYYTFFTRGVGNNTGMGIRFSDGTEIIYKYF